MTYYEMVTVIGTAIALILSLASLVRARSIKESDLRMELGKAFNNLDVVLSGLDGYLDYVHQSHTRVLAATGQRNSGAMVDFEKTFSDDKAKLQELLSTQPQRKSNYKDSSQDELEKAIVDVHAFHNQIAELRAKYQKIFDADEERRKEIRKEVDTFMTSPHP